MNFRAELRSILPAVKPIVRQGQKNDVLQTALIGDGSLVLKAIAALPNTSDLFPTRETYLDVGYAIKAALPGNPDQAFEIFSDWCGRWRDGTNDPEIVEADWRRMKPPFRRGAPWLYELAAQHGGGKFDRAEQWFAAPADPLFAVTETTPSDRRFTLVPLAEASRKALAEPSIPLIDGLLDARVMSVVYGDSNVGKTFVALDMAYHVASGRPWAGLNTTQGNVVYLAAEGGRGINKRAAALEKKYGSCDAFFIISSQVDLFQAEADLRPLVRDIVSLNLPVTLLVIDTLARAMAGGDENSTKDMGVFVRNCDQMRKALVHSHLMLVHHTGKDASRGARGSSALRAATDTEIEITERSIAVTKQRDLEKNLAFSFDLGTTALGENAKGKPITSCTVTATTQKMGPNDARRLSATEAAVLAAMHDLQERQPGFSFSTHDVAQIVYPGKQNGAGRARKQIEELTAAGLLQKVGRGKWTIFDPSRFFDADAACSTHDKTSAGPAGERPFGIFA